MYFKNNLYTHATNQVRITDGRRDSHNSRGYRSMYTRYMSISGDLLASGVSAITTALQSLENGYPGLLTYAGLFDDDGTVTAHYMEESANCFGGIKVTGIRYDLGDATEYVNGRKFSIDLEADYIDPTAGELVEFEQTIEFTGTGEARRVNIETQTGPVVRQITNRFTLRSITQSGRAVGLTAYPYAELPRPIRPQDEHRDRRRIVEGQPMWKGSRRINFPLSWSYIMEY